MTMSDKWANGSHFVNDKILRGKTLNLQPLREGGQLAAGVSDGRPTLGGQSHPDSKPCSFARSREVITVKMCLLILHFELHEFSLLLRGPSRQVTCCFSHHFAVSFTATLSFLFLIDLFVEKRRIHFEFGYL